MLSQDAETARRPSAVTATPTPVGVACERAQFAAAFQIPHLQRVVIRARRPRAARPASPPRHRPAAEWPARVRSLAAALQIPHLQRVVIRRGDRPPPVRRHRHAMTPSEWPARVRSSRPLSRSHTFSVLSSDAETARRPSGVTATPLTRVRVAFERAQLAPAFQIPHLQRAVIRRGDRPPPVRSSPPRHGRKPSGPRGCAARGRFPDPTPSASCPRTRRPPAARPASPPRH